MLTNTTFKLLLLLLGVGFMYPSVAQDIGLDTVPITSFRLTTQAIEAPQQILILNQQQIQQWHTSSIDELLRYLPGVEIRSRQPFGGQADISLRGSTFSQVLVLVDGLRINDPMTGHFTSHLPVAPHEIERIEILRGPAAALYGPDAVGGVIHILTKAFTDSPPIASGGKWGASWKGGEENLLAYQLGGQASTSNNKLLLSGGSYSTQTDGQLLPPDSANIRNDVQNHGASASVRYQITDRLAVAGRVGYDWRRFNARHFYTTSTFDLSREQVQVWRAQGKIQYNGEKGVTAIDAAYQSLRDSFLFNPAFSANINANTFSQVQILHNSSLSSSLQLLVGLQADRRTIESRDRGNHQTNHLGAFATAAYRPLPGLLILPMLRVDGDQNYGWEPLPHVSVSYQKNGLTFRGAAGKTIRAADFTERFTNNQVNAPILPERNIGFPDLEAERSWNYEAGIDLSRRFVRLSATGFYRQGRNLIDYALTNTSNFPEGFQPRIISGESYLLATNVNEVNTVGIETQVSWNVGGPAWQAYGHVGWMWVSSANATNTQTKYIATHANQYLSGSLTFQHKLGGVDLRGFWKTRNADEASAIKAYLAEQMKLVNLRLFNTPFHSS